MAKYEEKIFKKTKTTELRLKTLLFKRKKLIFHRQIFFLEENTLFIIKKHHF